MEFFFSLSIGKEPVKQYKVALKVMVHKERNKVLFAEAGNDFVDALFSFLTLPLGTTARLTAKESNIEAMKFGSVSSLYQSMAVLDEKYLWSKTCKQMLLKPRNSMEGYCRQLKLNIDDTPVQYFVCENWKDCCRYTTRRHLSTFRNQKCHCGKLMNVAGVYPSKFTSVDNGFVKENASFIIHDDLRVIPNDLGTSLCLLQMNGIKDTADIERKTLLISQKEVVDLLKLSLISKTPLTDLMLKMKQIRYVSNPSPLQVTIAKSIPSDKAIMLEDYFLEKNQMLGNLNPTENRIGNSLPSEECILVKLLVRKSNRVILFAIADEDFADFLFSFLTFPIGGVLQMLKGLSSLSCIDVLYKSMTKLSPERCIRSQDITNNLMNPQIFPKFEIRNQILPIGTALLTCESRNEHLDLNLADPKCSISGGFAKGPFTIMVTDDLVVTPMSSFDVVSYLEKMKVPLSDVEEMVINICLKEGLSILKAALTSTSALTNGLKTYIDKPVCNQKKTEEKKNVITD